MTGCRISKVRHKSAPHLVEVIPKPRGLANPGELHRYLDQCFENLSEEGVAAVAIVAIGFEGDFARASLIHADAFFGQTLLPSLVAEILRRDVASNIAADVVLGNL